MDRFEKEKFLKAIVDSCVNYINEDLKSLGKEEIKVDLEIIDAKLTSINALADRREDGTYIIGIYWGTYHWIDDFWKKMLTNPGFCKIISASEYSEAIATKFYPLMLILSLKCVIFHELGHIINGHVDYIKSKNQKDTKLYEKDNNCEDLGNIEAITWQSMEWNADDFASGRVIGQSTYKDVIKSTPIKDAGHGLWLATVSQVVTYSLMYMGLENRISSDFRKMKHLPLRFRLECIVNNMFGTYNVFNGKIPFNGTLEEYMIGMKRIEEWVNLFMKNQYNSNLNVSTENNKDELDESHRIYYRQVEQYYLYKLEYELKNYSHMKILFRI